MNAPQLWVWIGDDEDSLDLLRYVKATDRDILRQRVVVDRITALRAGVDPTHPAQRAVTSRPAVRGDFSEAKPTDLTTVISAAILVRVAQAAYRRGAEDGQQFAADMMHGIMDECMSQLAAARTSARRHAVGVLQIAFGRIADDIRALGAGHAEPDWQELIRVALTEDEQ